MRLLGIDYGKKKIGLAISEGLTASPLKVLNVHSLKDALDKVIKVIKDEQIKKVVIGLAESGESRALSLKFISQLKKIIIVETVEETLTTYSAKNLMLDLGIPKNKRKEDDAYAASLILENYLNE